MKQLLKWLLFIVCPLLAASCSDDNNNEPEIPTQNVAKNIVGSWLLSTSDADNWISYEFTETSRINAEIAQSGYYGTGTGFYSIETDKISGSYTTDRGQTFYLDWKVTEIAPFEIDIDIYDDNTYIGDAEIYRILSDVTVEAGTPTTPDFKKICGTSNVSDFRSLDKNIVFVDAASGELMGVKEGTTFVSFKTSNGIGAIKITVNGNVKSFAELLVGTWVYDAPAEKTWERYTYADNGYLSVQWATYDGVYDLNESKQTMYKIDGETVTFTLNVDAGQMNMRFETESINDFNWTYNAYDGTHFNGKYTAQRMLESITLSPQEVKTPAYQSLVGNAVIQGYKSHNDAVAKVNDSGEITALSKGRTYIDVTTNKGIGVIEVIVDAGAIPMAFEEFIGVPPTKVRESFGDKPYYEDETMIIYKNFTPDIDMIGFTLDSWTGNVKGIVITYKSTVNTAQVTTILNATFIPFTSQTTETFKAYMDSANRSDATVGVTWDIPKLTLTYVDLATDLFTDYSILIGMTRSEVIGKMEREPDSSNDQSQSFFFFDKKGIAIVSAYYTDFVNDYDNVHSVVTMFDDTMNETEITNYLKKKYPYYPEHSSDTELVFIPEGHLMEIFYMPKDKMVMYISTTSSSQSDSKAAVAAKLRKSIKSVNR